MRSFILMPVAQYAHRRPAVHRSRACIYILVVTVLMLGSAPRTWAALDLEQVESIALEHDPAVQMKRAQGEALLAQSVAEGQLPDPKLGLGIYNVPLDDFDIQREPTTQLRSKISQAFPRGDTLKYRQRYTSWRGKVEQARANLAERQLQRDVRRTYLELYYQLQAKNIVTKSRSLFKQLIDVTRVMFSAGRVSQQDVLQAQLELSRLQERTTRIAEKQEVQRAILSRWIGDKAWQEMAQEFPSLPVPWGKNELQAGLPEHPQMQVSNAQISANQQLINQAREQYKPGWNVALEYRKRFGANPDGTDRSDMMAAMVTFDLPLFTGKRQDQRLAASRKKTEAAKQQRSLNLRELQRQLSADYARWQRLGEQLKLYQSHLMREAIENTQAAIHSYQSGTASFITLMRASITELEVRLQESRMKVERAKVQANLLYLQPVSTSARLQGEKS